MQQIFMLTLRQMITFFLIMIIGYILCKSKCINENMDSVLSKLVSTVINPMVIFQNFCNNFRVEVLAEKMQILFAGAVIIVISYLLAYFLSKLFAKDRYLRNIYIYSFAIANLGYMGIPLVKAVFGDEVLFDMLVFTIPFYMYIHSIGLASLNPNHSKVSLKSFVNPIFAGMVLGAAVGLSGITLPDPVMSAASSIADCMTALPMLIAGFVIAKYPIRSLLGDYKIYLASVLRLVILPSAFAIVMKLLQLDQNLILVMLCVLAMPLGLNTIVFPAAYGGDTRPGASMALVSNIFAIITIPVIFAIFIK